MKKALFLIVLAALLLSLFGGAATVLADDGDNFNKAGQKVLKEKESLLQEEKANIEAYVLVVVADKVATQEEMITLNKMVDRFLEAKAAADDYLKLYGLATKTVLDAKMVEAIKNYYDGDGFFMYDNVGKTKRYFTSLIGEDVVVSKGSFKIAGGGQIVMIIILLVFLAVGCLGIKERNGGAIIIGFSLFCLLLILPFIH